MSDIIIALGDITKLEVDAIVNSADNDLLGGGGVDGAIHEEAGPKLLEECRKLNGCKTGEAKITSGYNLKAKYVIHTVAPRWYDDSISNKEELLRLCYKNVYKVAKENNIKTIALPCLGAGIFETPIDISARISIDEANKNEKDFERIILVCYKQYEYDMYVNYCRILEGKENGKG